MDQEFDGKGLTPYDPAHNSTYILAGKNNLGKKYWGLDLGKERKIKGGKIRAFPEVKGSFSGHWHCLPNCCKIYVKISLQRLTDFLIVEGELYTATVSDFSGSDPLIYKEPLRTEQYDSKILNSKCRNI